MRPVSLAAIFATVSGLLSGWMAVLAAIAATPDGHLPMASLYRGIAESFTVGFVCFGLLAAAWMLVAVGMLRRQRLGVHREDVHTSQQRPWFRSPSSRFRSRHGSSGWPSLRLRAQQILRTAKNGPSLLRQRRESNPFSRSSRRTATITLPPCELTARPSIGAPFSLPLPPPPCTLTPVR